MSTCRHEKFEEAGPGMLQIKPGDPPSLVGVCCLCQKTLRGEEWRKVWRRFARKDVKQWRGFGPSHEELS